MNNKELFKAVGSVDADLIEQAETAGRVRKKSYAKWGALAACLALAIGAAVYPFPQAKPSATPQISQQAPAAAPNGIRKFLNYNGYRYAFVGDGARFEFKGMELAKPLGTLDHDISSDIGQHHESVYADKDYAATFAVGGKLYEIPTYPSHFRIAVQYQQHNYLAEIVAKADDSTISATEYLDMSGLKAHARDIHISNHAGNEVLKKVTDHGAVESVIEGLYEAETARLTGWEYEAIAEAQAQGKSYQLKFNLQDGTEMAMYIIPELKVVSMGDAYYRLPDAFFKQSGDLFEGLKQEALPLY